MEDAMVTGRMASWKKAAGNAVLKDAGLNASQAINLLYSKLIEEKSAAFLEPDTENEKARWRMAAAFVDSIPIKTSSEFMTMTDDQIREARLRSRGLM